MQFASWIDIDISRAAATLNKMSESLVSYVSLKGSDEAEKPAEPAAATGETETPAGQEKGTE